MADRGASTRQALLDAGLELLRELDPRTLIAALRTREIARRAGVSAPTFFHHFRTVDAYADALVDQIFSPDPNRLRGAITQALGEVQELRLPAEQSIAYHTRDLERLAADPDFRLRMALWALAGPTVAVSYGRSLQEIDELLVPQIAAFHRAWGREVRAPLDLRSYLALQLALLNGSVWRHLADPSVMTPDRYGRAAAAFSMVMLRPSGDRRTMDDRLSEMNWYPSAKLAAPATPTRRDLTRTRLLDAAAELFEEYGYQATSIRQVAEAAGVHVATLYDHFESKAQLAITIFDAQAIAHIDASREPHDADASAALRQHLVRVADFAGTRPDVARPYLVALACGDQPADFADLLRRRTLGLVKAAQRASAIEDSPENATDQALVATIGAILRHPGEGGAIAAAAGVPLRAPPTQ